MTELNRLCAIIDAKIQAVVSGGFVSPEGKGYIRALYEIKEYINKKNGINERGDNEYLSALVKE